MRESILTIPISEILEPREGCPICRMRDMLEQRTVEYIMGAAMMEPDVRIETNRAGFCSAHFAQMLNARTGFPLPLCSRPIWTRCMAVCFQGKSFLNPRTPDKKSSPK